jgi:hypothetical protein
MEGFGAIVLLGLAFAFTIWIFILVPAGMARARGRGQLVWVLVSLIFSPLLAVLLLWALGDAPGGDGRR